MKGVAHYKKDGTIHRGGTHKMPNGDLHTGDTHNAGSEKLFHFNELSESAKRVAKKVTKKQGATKKKVNKIIRKRSNYKSGY